MSLLSVYQRFLQNPNASSLADAATLHYITTLTSIHDPTKIVKQLSSPALQKREQKILFAVESDSALAVEVETTIHFLSNGGAYLPNLDDNFLADRVVTFPINHFVQFDANQQIQQLRLSWDQGSLLKSIDVIGARGKNWPIRDGKDHVRLIAQSVATSAKVQPATGSSRNPEEVIVSARVPPKSPTKGRHQNVTRDPHASLSLFGPRDETEANTLPAVVAPRASAKPPPRDYHDLFVGGPGDEAAPTASKGRNFAGARNGEDDAINPPSQTTATRKQYDEAIAPKGGAGKNYLPSRLFDHDSPAELDSPNKHGHQAEHFYKPNPTKYQHFDFADGSDGIPATANPISPLKPKTTKHGSQLKVDDFSTPEQPKNKIRGQEVRHFGWSDDEGDLKSPVKMPKVDKPRRDAETHFQFQDDGTPAAESKRAVGHARGAYGLSGLSLYENNLYSDDGPGPQVAASSRPVQPLGNATNVQHRKAFDSQFEIKDVSPAAKEKTTTEQRSAGPQHSDAVKMMGSNWETSDQSPDATKKENLPIRPTNTGIKTGGDGMGGRKGAGRQWGFGDDSDGEEAGGVNGGAFQKGIPGKKQHQAPANNALWDY